MPLRLGESWRFELSFWWEERPATASVQRVEPLRLRDRSAIRAHLDPLRAHPEDIAALRRFLREATPGLALPIDDDLLLEHATTAILTGLVRLAIAPPQPLSTFGAIEEEQPPAPVIVVPPPAAPAEEICWPCLRAAASAQALRDASTQGVPFIAEM